MVLHSIIIRSSSSLEMYIQFFIIHNVHDQCCQRILHLIWLLITKADCKTSLWICVYQKHFLSCANPIPRFTHWVLG